MKITSFQGQYRFLSNFWPVEVVYEGETYPTVEHAYQAAKAVSAEDRKRIQKLPRPGQAKQVGRHVQIRPDWEQVKLDVMRDLVLQKFTHDIELNTLLRSTGNQELIEGNAWGDTFWGMCGGVGENHLGKILMWVRQVL